MSTPTSTPPNSGRRREHHTEFDPHLDPARVGTARTTTRRHFFGRLGSGVGVAALASMLGEHSARALAAGLRGGARESAPQSGAAIGNGGVPAPHFAPRAKRVVYLHMAGSPPQQDLWDPKPELQRLDGQPCPDELLARERFAFIKGHPKLLGSPYSFAQHGKSGAWVSELLPHQAKIVDKIAIVRSVVTDEINHAPAELFLYSGSPRPGRPSMGSWSVYGLGSENRDLPGFVVLVSGGKNPSAGKSVWGSGFLPTVYSGVQCRSSGEPVLHVGDPPGLDRTGRRRMLDSLARLNALGHAEHGDPETLARIEQYELAFRMQMSVPETMDLAGESKETLELYGADPNAPSFARNCLLARRLVERGVRFVQLFDHGWDVHGTSAGDD
ncbi:MAG: DUF1501 domain-containing protein, partial [Phycisphaerales bacterium]